MKSLLAIGLFFVFLQSHAQLVVTVEPLRTSIQKAIVPLEIVNGFTNDVQSARAICFLLDENGKMVGQSTKWVIGQNKTMLRAGETNIFNFVVTSPQPFTSTNFIAKVVFSRIILSSNQIIDPRKSVLMTQ